MLEKVVFEKRICNPTSGERIVAGDTVDVKLITNDVVTLTVVEVTDDGRGFTFDRTVAEQDYRAEDVNQVMPNHDCACPSESGS